MDHAPANPDEAAGAARPPKLLEQLRIHLRTRHYSIRTEEAYLDWARRFILHHGKRHPKDMGAVEVEAFLSHLAVERQVSASTQNQAKAALLYLYKQVLGVDLPWLDEVVQAKRPRRLPVVPRNLRTAPSRRVHHDLGRSAALQILAIPPGIAAVCALRLIPISGARIHGELFRGPLRPARCAN